MTFDQAFDKLIGHEGGYSFHPADPGGETMWGITARVARANGYSGDMKALPRDRAKQIYQKLYWEEAKCPMLPDALRFDVFDAAVNSGVSQAARWLQEAVGSSVDGNIGPKTIEAADTADAYAPARFNGARLMFMTNLPTWASFGKGWARRVAGNLQSLGK